MPHSNNSSKERLYILMQNWEYTCVTYTDSRIHIYGVDIAINAACWLPIDASMPSSKQVSLFFYRNAYKGYWWIKLSVGKRKPAISWFCFALTVAIIWKPYSLKYTTKHQDPTSVGSSCVSLDSILEIFHKWLRFISLSSVSRYKAPIKKHRKLSNY